MRKKLRTRQVPAVGMTAFLAVPLGIDEYRWQLVHELALQQGELVGRELLYEHDHFFQWQVGAMEYLFIMMQFLHMQRRICNNTISMCSGVSPSFAGMERMARSTGISDITALVFLQVQSAHRLPIRHCTRCWTNRYSQVCMRRIRPWCI